MGEIVDSLLKMGAGGKGYDIPWSDVRDLQVAAMNERLGEHVDRIKLVGLRARDAGITEIRDRADIVPLLLPHTAYKSYPESFLVEQKWDRLTRWLGTVYSHPIENVDLDGIVDIDDWMSRLGAAGIVMSCSSGTTGKSAMLPSSKQDVDFFCADSISAIEWGSGVKARQDHLVFGLSPIAKVPRNEAVGEAMGVAFGIPGKERFSYPVPPITIGAITRMVALRKAMADGTARPNEIAEFEETSEMRQKAVDAAAGLCADALIAARNEKLQIVGMWATLYKVAEEVRNRGYGAKDFRADNAFYAAGGLKGAQLPPDYREYVYETFNLQPDRNFQMYSMQEIQTTMPRCQKGGRYHMPPWLVCLPLDKDGAALLDHDDSGVVEGRAAFFDLSLDGRWGGVISGDKIEVDFGPCACGAKSPSIRDTIVRYSDLTGDDKIACSGTVDAYVRGLA